MLVALLLTTVFGASTSDDYLNLSFGGDGSEPTSGQVMEARNRTMSKAQHGVSSTAKGDASHTIPIVLPAGLVSPSVSLNYSSAAGEHTWVARGWSLGHGQVSIQRIVGREAAQAFAGVDQPHRITGGGFDGVLHWDNGWVYTSSGTTEGSFAYDPLDGSWRVSRNGVTSFLEPDKTVTYPSGAVPSEWFVSTVVDVSGNGMQFTWTGSRLDRIEYGAVCTQTGAALCVPSGNHLVQVDFEYGARFANSVQAVAGVLHVRDSWLDRIKVSTRLFSSASLNHRLTTELLAHHDEFRRGRLLTSVESVSPSDGTRVLASMDYSDHSDAVFMSAEAPVSLARSKSTSDTTSVDRPDNPESLVYGMTGTIGELWDLSGDGIQDVYYRKDDNIDSLEPFLEWGLRDTTEPVGPAQNLFDTPAGLNRADAIYPEMEQVQCGQHRVGRYGISVMVDVDGDGELEQVESAIYPQPYTLGGSETCTGNAEVAPNGNPYQWTIRRSITSIWPAPIDVVAPFKFPSIGSALWRDPNSTGINAHGETFVDGLVEFLDMNGDGWQDVVHVENGEVQVYLHTTVMATGWSLTPVRWDTDLGMAPLGHTTTVTYQDVDPDEYTLINDLRRYDAEPIESYLVGGFRDLNGDGLVDYVRTCDAVTGAVQDGYYWCGSDVIDGDPTTGVPASDRWKVWFNTGSGFASAPSDWLLPQAQGLTGNVDAMSRLREGSQAAKMCVLAPGAVSFDIHDEGNRKVSVGELSGATKSLPIDTLQGSTGDCRVGTDSGFRGGFPARQEAALMDFDGDGRVDVVDAMGEVWFRNLGDRFGGAELLPIWWPHALSETYGMTIVVAKRPASTSPYAYTKTHKYTAEAFRLMDLNGDRSLDFVYAQAFSGDWVNGSPSITTTSGGVEYGATSPAGLLEWIQVETGATTSIAYTASTYMDPAGFDVVPGVSPVQVLQKHTMPNPKMLVTEVYSEDPVSEQTATQYLEYADGVCELGSCMGFETVTQTDYIGNPEIYAVLSADLIQSQTTTDYLLSRDYTVPEHIDVSIGNSYYVPGEPLVSGALVQAESTHFTYVENPVGADVYSLWTSQQDVSEWASDVSGPPRSYERTISRGPLGHPTLETHTPDAASDLDDRLQLHTEWGSSVDGTIYRPIHQWTVGVDLATGTLQTVEEGRFGYDGGSPGATVSFTSGLLTEQEICSGLVGSLCSESIDWLFGRSTRGQINRTRSWDGPQLLSDDRVTQFSYGETVRKKERNVLGHVITRNINPDGRVVAEQNANGVWNQTALDSWGRSTLSRVKSSGGSWYTTQTVVHDTSSVPNRVTTTQFNHLPDGSSNSRVAVDVLDGFGNVRRRAVPGPDGVSFLVTDTETDALGRTLARTEPRLELMVNAPAPMPLTAGWQSVMGYDGWGRARYNRTDPSFDPKILTETAPGVTTIEHAGFLKSLETDTRGRLKNVVEGDGVAQFQTGSYRYDGRDRVVFFADANANEHRYTYDGVGRLDQVERQPANASAYEPFASYRYVGPRVVESKDGAGQVRIVWDYDALGRTIRKDLWDESVSDWLIYEWEWDTQWIGARSATYDPSGHTTYDYKTTEPWGELGEVAAVTRHNNFGSGLTQTFSHTYDIEGNGVETVWPSGVMAESIRNANGWETTDRVTLTNSSVLEYERTYDSRGLLTRYERTAGPIAQWLDWTWSSPMVLDSVAARMDQQHVSIEYPDYLGNGWLASKRIVPLMDPDQKILYDYDSLGRVERMDYDDHGAIVLLESYQFDPAGNLQAHDRYKSHWDYDPVGRFGESTGRVDVGAPATDVHTWDSVTGRMSQWTETTLSGTIVRDFFYDGAGRLTSIENDQNQETSLWYDVDDKLVYENRDGDEYFRFQGARTGPNETIESVSQALRVVTDNGVQSVHVSLLDQDGHAMFVWDEDGLQVSREVTGVYGLPVDPALGLGWAQGSLWEVDGLHGMEEDRLNRVTHSGTRHMLFRDGLWMQPEPLLALGVAGIDPAEPLAMGQTYARGNPLLFADDDGYYAEIVIEIPSIMMGGYSLYSNASSGDYTSAAIDAVGLVVDIGALVVPGVPGGVGMTIKAGRAAEAAGDVLGASKGFAAAADAGKGFAAAADAGKGAKAAAGKACFVAGTEVVTTQGPRPIEEIVEGDRVLAMPITTHVEGDWVLLDATSGDLDECVDRSVHAPCRNGDAGDALRGAGEPAVSKTGGVARALRASRGNRSACDRLHRDAPDRGGHSGRDGTARPLKAWATGAKRALMAGLLAACDPSPAVTELPHDLAVVQVYDARTGGWVEEVAGHLESGEAFLHEGHLLQVTGHGFEDRGFAAVGQLSEADATWTTDAALAMPKLEDWVLVLGSDMDAAHHVRAAELLGGESFAFGGRVFESAQVGDLLAVRATGDVVGRVVDTFVRPAPEVIDAEIAYADGTVDGLTGTPNHPFWVDAVRDYVPLGDLKVGTVLHVQGGGEAVLVSKTWRQGDFEVFDFEVEGLHNFYVGGSDVAGVLVHNSSLKTGPNGGRVGPSDRLRQDAQRAKRNQRREDQSRSRPGVDQKKSGEGFRDKESANKGPGGKDTKKSSNRDGRERNVGHSKSEEHSIVAKGAGGRGARR